MKVDWGDGNIEKGIPISATEIGQDSYTYTFTATHTTFSDVSLSITAYIYHVNPNGKDGAAEDQDSVSVCVAPPTQAVLTMIKEVVNDNTGTSTAADFSMHVKIDDADVNGSPADGSETGTDYILESVDAAKNKQVSEQRKFFTPYQ